MVVLSSLSVVAYKCVFHNGFLSSPESYFFHLFYYRSHHCADSSINWEFLGIQQTENITEILQMPDETHLTWKNYQISLVQLILNCLLVVTSFSALGEIYKNLFWKFVLDVLFTATTFWNIYFVSRRVSYWILFIPYCLIFHLTIVMDFIGGTSYADDRLRSFVCTHTWNDLNTWHISLIF